jgi:hypothetical protein
MPEVAMKEHKCCKCAMRVRKELDQMYETLEMCRDVLMVCRVEEKMGIGTRVCCTGEMRVSLSQALSRCDQVLKRRERKNGCKVFPEIEQLPLTVTSAQARGLI